ALDIFKGSTDKSDPIKYERFEDGVRWGSMGLAGHSVLSLFFAPIIPWLCRCIGHRITWALGSIVQGVCLALPIFITKLVTTEVAKYLALVIILICGGSWAVNNCNVLTYYLDFYNNPIQSHKFA